ncbi:MAG TPA: hypothetical protein DEQ02_09845 [Ruminococcaceae bacterium]|nr:hypothetical protein [Oscillospiraceae bacterium]
MGLKVYRDYKTQTGDETPAVIASTASPYKFPRSVLAALGEGLTDDEFSAARSLEGLTGQFMPAALKNLNSLPVRHDEACDTAGMRRFVTERLGII